MRGVNGTVSSEQTHRENAGSNNPEAENAKKTQSLVRLGGILRDAEQKENVRYIDKSSRKLDKAPADKAPRDIVKATRVGQNHSMMPAKFFATDSSNSQSEVRDSCVDVSNPSAGPSENIASGAAAFASSKTKPATRPSSVVETLKTLGISLVFVKHNPKERQVRLCFEGKNVTLKQVLNHEGQFPNSVAVLASGDCGRKLDNKLREQNLTFLNLMTKLKPEDTPESGGILGFISSLWS